MNTVETLIDRMFLGIAKRTAAIQMAYAEMEAERDSLAAALAEANKDADRLAKELQDWIVFAEANDQIYAARSGMNAMLHHLKRKEGK